MTAVLAYGIWHMGDKAAERLCILNKVTVCLLQHAAQLPCYFHPWHRVRVGLYFGT